MRRILDLSCQPSFSFDTRKEQKRSHTLRYVLKNRKTGEVLFAVVFTLYLKEDVDENGNLKKGVEGGKPLDQLPKDVAEKHLREKNEEVRSEQVAEKAEQSTNDHDDGDID